MKSESWDYTSEIVPSRLNITRPNFTSKYLILNDFTIQINNYEKL